MTPVSYASTLNAGLGMLEETRTLLEQVRKILPYWITPRAAAFLAHVLHFEGVGDNTKTFKANWIRGFSR